MWFSMRISCPSYSALQECSSMLVSTRPSPAHSHAARRNTEEYTNLVDGHMYLIASPTLARTARPVRGELSADRDGSRSNRRDACATCMQTSHVSVNQPGALRRGGSSGHGR